MKESMTAFKSYGSPVYWRTTLEIHHRLRPKSRLSGNGTKLKFSRRNSTGIWNGVDNRWKDTFTINMEVLRWIFNSRYFQIFPDISDISVLNHIYSAFYVWKSAQNWPRLVNCGGEESIPTVRRLLAGSRHLFSVEIL